VVCTLYDLADEAIHFLWAIGTCHVAVKQYDTYI